MNDSKDSNENIQDDLEISKNNSINTLGDEVKDSEHNITKVKKQYDDNNYDDLGFCINVALKEAIKEEKLVNQIFLTMLSAYTNNPINLTINAPSGEGKSHVLKKVSDLFPKEDVVSITDMSNKAVFHTKGYFAIRNDDGEYVNIENELEQLIQDFETIRNELKNSNSIATNDITELKNKLRENQHRRNELRKNAVKVIDLNQKMFVFLDTPREGLFEALMTLLSHDKYEVEYQYVDTSGKTGIVTKTNVLRGWPAVIFAQAIDYTRHRRYQEIQRRFIVTNPKMTIDKYESAVDLILEKKGNPDFVYQQKVLSDDDKNKAKQIILKIKDDILSYSATTKIGKNNTLVPFGYIIRRSLSKNATAQDMTFMNRLYDLIGLLTIIYHKKRPFMEIKPAFESESFRVPLSLLSDLKHAFSLINNSPGGLRPYVSDWYNNVFLELWQSKSQPNSKIDKEGREITEQRIGVTTEELIQKTKKVMNKTYATKSILQEFVYPLLNLEYIDKIRSEIDRRAKIYFPILDITNINEEKNSNLFLSDKKNKLIDDASNNNINFIINEDKKQIISKIREVMKYSSASGNLTTLRFADVDTDLLAEDYELDKTVEEIVDKYYSDLPDKQILEEKQNNLDNAVIQDNDSKTLSSEEYLQITENDSVLQQNQENNVKNYNCSIEKSNNLFFNKKKNNLIYSCYRCNYQKDNQSEYEKHCVLTHPGKPAYPSLSDIQKDGLKPQGKPWE